MFCSIYAPQEKDVYRKIYAFPFKFYLANHFPQILSENDG